MLRIDTNGVFVIVRLASADTALSSGRSEWTGLLLVLYIAKHVRGDLAVRLDNLQVVWPLSPRTPQALEWKFAHGARRSPIRRSERIAAGSALGCARGRHPRLGLAVRCGDLALSLKKYAFLYVFHVQPKHPNGVIFVNIEGFRPCLSKPSYGAPQWALMVRLMQKERLESPQKSLFCVTGPFWLFWSFLVNIPFGSFWLAISKPGWVSRKKSAICGLA